MGKPKFSRKKYETPSHPWQEDRIKTENELIKKYGLKNKREVWKAETALRKYRGQARDLRARVGSSDVQSKKEGDQLLMHLNRMNILPPNSKIDDVLALQTESILSRRLQTLTYLKGLANTPDQARQLISHGHIAIGNRRVTVPGYIVTKEEEGEIGYIYDSPLNDMMHPARPRSDFKSIPIKKESKPKEEPAEEVKKKTAGEKVTAESTSTPESDKDATKEEIQIPAKESVAEDKQLEEPKTDEETLKEETKESEPSIESKEEKKEEKTKDERKEKQTEDKDKTKKGEGE